MEFNKNDVKIRENVSNDIPRHEVLLSFNEDCQGEAFRDWWEDSGSEEFGKWCKDYYFLKHKSLNEDDDRVGTLFNIHNDYKG